MRYVILVILIWTSIPVMGQQQRQQSSSLFVARRATPRVAVVENPQSKGLKPLPAGIRAYSYTAVELPKPRIFAKHDLVTIVIREESSATSEGKLETEKESKVDGSIDAFPRFRLKDMLDGRLEGRTLGADKPQVKLGNKREFTGEGDYERKDRMTTRITARVLDVKPNGLLALEARTNIKNDDEELVITVTGYCKATDISSLDDTILSTKVFGLRVSKQHKGEIRKSTQKGFLTKVLDAIFNF